MPQQEPSALPELTSLILLQIQDNGKQSSWLKTADMPSATFMFYLTPTVLVHGIILPKSLLQSLCCSLKGLRYVFTTISSASDDLTLLGETEKR